MNLAQRLPVKTILCASLIANLGLVIWATQRQPVTPERPNATQPGAATSASTFGTTLERPTSHHPNVAPFRWESLESTNYATFVSNLRRIGCPEETIHDLVVTDVNKAYAPRMAAAASRANDRYWMNSQKRRQLTSEIEADLQKLNQERKEVLAQLLGTPVREPATLDLNAFVQQESAFGFLPSEKRDALREMLHRYQEAEEALQRRSNGLMTAEDREEWDALSKQRKAELASLLNATELEAYNLRNSSTAENVRSRFGEIATSEEDFRELYRIRKTYEDAVAQLGEGAADGTEQRQLLRDQREEQMRSYLGEDRYSRYQKSQDMEYQNLTSIAARHNLPPETVDLAYDINRLARQQRDEVMKNPAYTPEARQAALQGIQAATDQELQRMLGPDAFKTFHEPNRTLFLEDGSGRRTVVVSTSDANGRIIRQTMINEPGRGGERGGPIRISPRTP